MTVKDEPWDWVNCTEEKYWKRGGGVSVAVLSVVKRFLRSEDYVSNIFSATGNGRQDNQRS